MLQALRNSTKAPCNFSEIKLILIADYLIKSNGWGWKSCGFLTRRNYNITCANDIKHMVCASCYNSTILQMSTYFEKPNEPNEQLLFHSVCKHWLTWWTDSWAEVSQSQLTGTAEQEWSRTRRKERKRRQDEKKWWWRKEERGGGGGEADPEGIERLANDLHYSVSSGRRRKEAKPSPATFWWHVTISHFSTYKAPRQDRLCVF